MRVSQHDGPAAEPVVLEVVEDDVRLRAGVYDRALERGLVGDDVAVGLKLPDGQGFDKHTHSSSVSTSMVTGPSFTLSTSISAPKRPVSTLKPRSRQRAITRS